MRDVEDEWGLTESHATCAHLVVLTGMALSWATAEPAYCFKRGRDNGLRTITSQQCKTQADDGK